MLILIAESKTMSPCEIPQSTATLTGHEPAGEAVASAVMAEVGHMSAHDLAKAGKFSTSMAVRALRMANEFPYKLTGQNAIEAYTGVVFKALDYSSLSPTEKTRVNEDVRIISSLYGWLRPDDIIKSYRFDFTSQLAPGNVSFASYWRKDVTIALVKELKERGRCDLINLLPSDAAKYIDWKLVKKFANVWKIDFKEVKDGGRYATPNAGKLKTLRGKLLRDIVTRDLTDARQLCTLATDEFLPLGTPDYPDQISFCV